MGVSITLTDNQVYVGLVLFLMVLQIYQRAKLHSVQKELKQVWTQLAIIHFAIGNKINKDPKEFFTQQEEQDEAQS